MENSRKIGKPIHRAGQGYDAAGHCLSVQPGPFLRIVEALEPCEDGRFGRAIPMINPTRTLAENLCKDYAVALSSQLPFIETERVHSFDRLLALRDGPRRMVGKPLISERGLGTVMLPDLSRDELRAWFERYTRPVTPPPPGLAGWVAARQGVIVQPYLSEFPIHGERKIAVVHGEVTLGYHVLGDSGSWTSIHSGATIRSYGPTPAERDLALRAFDVFHRVYAADFARIDLVGPPNDLRINEIEAVNPNFCEDDLDRPADELDRHHRLLFQRSE